MGRQGNDPTALHSSIALLQERFRQLERVKEMREEKQLLRGSAMMEPECPNLVQQHQPRWFFHSDLVRPSRPLSAHYNPSLRLVDSYYGGDRPEFRALETSLSIGLWPTRSAAAATTMQSLSSCGEADVDTSLHL